MSTLMPEANPTAAQLPTPGSQTTTTATPAIGTGRTREIGKLTGSYALPVQQSNRNITQAKTHTYKAPIAEVTPEATTQGLMTQMLDNDSRYIQAARNRADEESNRRGLLNSSLAAGNAERAAIETALPLAQQDAQTHFQTMLANQQAQERALAQNAELGTQVNLSNAAEYNAITKMQEEVALQSKLMRMDYDIKSELETLRQTYEIQKNLDTSLGTMYDGALRSVSNVLNNHELTASQASASVRTIVNNLKSGLQFMSGMSRTPVVYSY